jgi:glycosyltransferase involved in cell wall biosynthesis
MTDLAICTIIAKNYLAHARCLTESFLAQHPGGQVFVLLADEIDGAFDPAAERFTTIEARSLGIPEFEQMAFRYSVVEFNTAVKPFFMEYLFERYDLPSLCYFDPDIYFYQPLARLKELLASQAVVLTPHLLDFLDDNCMPDEPYILRAGVYNLGFIGLARGPDLHTLLRWWQRKLIRDCVIDVARGLFVDQRWIDLVPGMFDRVAILRDPGYNAAYWNLKGRAIRREQGCWRANDAPLTFYHFSGLPMHDLNAISKHQNRFTLADLPAIEPLFAEYRDRLLANGYHEVQRLPYAYSRFDNGVAIPDAARHLWRNLGEGARWPRPFHTQEHGSFFSWLNQEVQEGAGRWPLISNLAMELYRQRWDLQQAFPDVLGVHREAYANWFVVSVEEQHQLDPAFVAPLRASLAEPGRGITGALAPQPSPPAAGARPPAASISLALRDLRAMLHARQLPALPEAPLLGRPTLKRRVYYAVRNPLRRLGLHRSAKRLIGRRIMKTIYRGMVWDQGILPRELFRSTGAPPPEAFFGVPAGVEQPNGALAVETLALELGAVNALPVDDAAPRIQPGAGYPPGLNVVGYLRAETGMGEVPRAVLRALAAAGYPVAQTDLSNADWARAEDRSVLHLPEGHPYNCNLLCVNADMLPYVAEQLGRGFFAGTYTIGFWHWETANFPTQWHDRFDYLNEVWVDSQFVQKSLAAVAPIPVVNVQLPINAHAEAVAGRRELGLDEERFLFLFSFDMRSFLERKHPHGLIEAYRRAFGPAYEHTGLVIKATNLEAFPQQAAGLQSDLASVGGTLIARYMDRRRLGSLFASCDAYVSLHRSEGFGLTLAEAMALGKPTIATAYSGNMDFMTPSNSYLVGYRLVEIERDYGPYLRGDEWAEPDLDHAAELMRHAATNARDAARIGARAAADIRRLYSSEAVARRMIARLERIGAWQQTDGWQPAASRAGGDEALALPSESQ